MKTVVVLGAGMVVAPMAKYLLESSDIKVIFLDKDIEKAKRITAPYPHAQVHKVDISDNDTVANFVAVSDVVVSLLPYTFHPRVAKICLAHGKSMVTTSYVSPEMQDLHEEAIEKGILLLNEMGLDPGLDHISAMNIIDRAKETGGKIEKFSSFCGGLPAPEANNNPWGYKFSWNPLGVLLAGENGAHYLNEGKEIEISGEDLFSHHWPLSVDNLSLEAYPNRDSFPYRDLYGIEESSTVLRGTLRYPGWCQTMQGVKKLGLTSKNPLESLSGQSYETIMRRILQVSDEKNLQEEIRSRLDPSRQEIVLSRLEWLDIFSQDIFTENASCPIEFFSHVLLGKMQYQSNERDMIVLQHEFQVQYPESKYHITSTLKHFGNPGGDSAMAQTVSIPAAIAVKLILEGKISLTGVCRPLHKEIYHPVLKEIEKFGIVFIETEEEIKRAM